MPLSSDGLYRANGFPFKPSPLLAMARRVPPLSDPLLALLLKNAGAAEKNAGSGYTSRPIFGLSEQNAQAMEHTGLTGGTCPACLAMRATKRSSALDELAELGQAMGLYEECWATTGVAAEPNTETVTINGLPYHRLVATDVPSEGMAGKADEVMKGILDGTLSRPKVKQIGDAVAERTKKDSGGDALGGAIGRSIRHGSFMERRTPYSD